MYKRCVMELAVKRLELSVDALRKTERSSHLLTAQLIWPRPSIALRTNGLAVPLRRGATDWEEAGWSERIQFKEVVQGPFGLHWTLSDGLGAREWQRLAATLGGVLTRLFYPPLEEVDGLLVAEPLRFVFRTASGEKGLPPAALGEGRAEWEADHSERDGRWQSFDVPLRAPRDIHRTVRTGRAAGSKTRKIRLARQGDEVGVLTAAVRFLDR